MKANDIPGWFRFTLPPTDDCFITCPDCREESSIVEWNETETFCEDCGEHGAIRCPKCDNAFDIVWDDKKEFVVRYP